MQNNNLLQPYIAHTTATTTTMKVTLSQQLWRHFTKLH